MKSRAVRACLVCVGGLFFMQSLWAALPIERWQHSSGAWVYQVHRVGLPLLDVQIDFDAGARRDPPAQSGLAVVSADMMHKGVAAQAGAPALDEAALGQAWADLAASFGVHAGMDTVSVSLRTLTDGALPMRVADLAGRQLAAPAWDATVWARERAALLASLREAATRAATRAAWAFQSAVYGGHPYGQLITADSLTAIAVADMAAWHKRSLQPCHARVAVVGALDRRALQAWLDRLLGPLAATATCTPLPGVADVPKLAAGVDLRIDMPAAQTQVWVGQPGVARQDPDFLALLVGNHILGGGGFTSRLTQAVREQRGLSYSVGSSFAPGRHAGAFSIVLQTRPDQAAQALGVVQDELLHFVQNGPTEAEMQAAQDGLINGFALRMDSNRKLLGQVANIAWNELPLDYLDTWTERVRALRASDVQRAMARAIQPDRLVRVVVGPGADGVAH